jgi:hypothetical protein
MGFLASVPPVPPPPHASAIQHLSVAFFVIGLLLVTAILPPARRACRERMDAVVDYFHPEQREVVTEAPAPEASAPTRTRKEIENFDLDIFK